VTTWQLTIDCRHPRRMVDFWASALGYEPVPAPEPFPTWKAYYVSIGVPAEEFDPGEDGTDRLQDPRGRGPSIWFQVVPEDKTVKNRLHLDVFPEDRVGTGRSSREEVDKRVAELLALGATVAWRHPSDAGGDDHYAVTMRDPEGNEFCVS
jgi:hypothetical protein